MLLFFNSPKRSTPNVVFFGAYNDYILKTQTYSVYMDVKKINTIFEFWGKIVSYSFTVEELM